MPFGLETAIALDEIVQAEPSGPASGAAVWAAAAEFLQDGDLSVLQDEVAVRQKTVGALRASVYKVVWIGEIFECYWRIRFVRWKRQLKDKTVGRMGSVVDTKGVVIVEVRNRDDIFVDIQETCVMLPCL